MLFTFYFLAVASTAKESAVAQGSPQNALFFVERSVSDPCGDRFIP